MEAIVRPEVVSGQSVCRLALSDITERRRVEAALQESEERYRVIVESSRDLIFFLDQGGRLRWSNQASRELFGAVPADDDLFRSVHPDDAPQLAAAWRSAREGEGSAAKISYRLRAADGGYRTLESSFRKISFAGEELWCVVSTDTTELTRLRRKVSAQQGIAGMVGRDPKMLELNASIRELAEEDVPVLILGESGTGKELIAAAIHREGPRAAKNFVAINCGALPDTLLETELFGHVKGSFTGAHRDKKGRFELADGGSIFLDEVGDLSLAMQVKLLRVLQEGTFEKVGAETSCKVDVRVISATNKDLKREVAANRFREDLFYRLSVVPLDDSPAARAVDRHSAAGGAHPRRRGPPLRPQARSRAAAPEGHRGPRDAGPAHRPPLARQHPRTPERAAFRPDQVQGESCSCPSTCRLLLRRRAATAAASRGASRKSRPMRRCKPWSRPGGTPGKRPAAWACPGPRSTGICRRKGPSTATCEQTDLVAPRRQYRRSSSSMHHK